MRHVGELERAVAAAACAPLDLEVIRDRPIELPGATLADPRALKLAAVPTCDAERRPAFLPADPDLSTFVAAVERGSPAERAGLRRGDAIASVNGKRVLSFRDINALSAEFLPPPAAGGSPTRGARSRASRCGSGSRTGASSCSCAAKEKYVDEHGPRGAGALGARVPPGAAPA